MNEKTANIKKWLTDKVNSIANNALRETCLCLLTYDEFFIAPAAVNKHQAYTGGLAEHTMQVMDLSLSFASAETLIYQRISKDVIIAATLWHDFGKIWDYKKNEEFPKPNEPEWKYTRHRWTIRHLVRSYAEFYRSATDYGCDEELIEQVSHCILAHHGRNEWGSPVTPLMAEASMIHSADTISADYIDKPNIFLDERKNWDKI